MMVYFQIKWLECKSFETCLFGLLCLQGKPQDWVVPSADLRSVLVRVLQTNNNGVCICIHTYVHTHTCTYAYTCTLWSLCPEICSRQAGDPGEPVCGLVLGLKAWEPGAVTFRVQSVGQQAPFPWRADASGWVQGLERGSVPAPAARQAKLPLTQLFVPVRSSPDWIKPTHTAEGTLLYSVYQFKQCDPETPSQTHLEWRWTRWLGTHGPVKPTHKSNPHTLQVFDD